VAIQSGDYAGKTIRRILANEPALPPFRYFDKGNLATISPTFAIFERGRWKLSGWLAKVLWACVHILYLSGFENRVRLLLEWQWGMLARRGGARVIEDPSYAQLTSVHARPTVQSAKQVA